MALYPNIFERIPVFLAFPRPPLLFLLPVVRFFALEDFLLLDFFAPDFLLVDLGVGMRLIRAPRADGLIQDHHYCRYL